MPLTLSAVLSCTDLGLSLVAGQRGVDTRGTVRWIHSSELPDPTRWLQGNDILLTTGFGIYHSAEEQQKSLIAKLDERGCVALGIALGDWLKSVPSVILAEAEARAFPIFLVPYDVPFSVVTKRVAELIFQEQYTPLRRSIDLHRELLAIVLSGKDPQALIQLMLRQVPSCGCILFDFYGNPVVEVGEIGGSPAEIWPAVRGHWRRDRSHIEFQGRHLTISAIRLDQDVEGLLVFSSPNELNENEGMLFEQSVAAVQLSLARRQSARSSRRSIVGELVAEVIAGGLPARAIAHRLTRLGFRGDTDFTVLCMPIPPHVTEDSVCGFVEDQIADRRLTPIVGACQGRIFCIVPSGEEVAQCLVDGARKRGWQNFNVGRSMLRASVADFEVGVREAMIATQAGRGGGVIDVSEIGLRGLVPRIASDGWAQVYVDQVLGPILRAQESERTHLMETLVHYLRHNCRPGSTAAALGIHRHTLAYRLNRITELSGRDPRRGRDMVELGLALEFRDALENQTKPPPRDKIH